jgi:hypothetical protein
MLIPNRTSNIMPAHTEITSQTPLAPGIKKVSVRHVHLHELIERHKMFILAGARGLDDRRPEHSPVGLLAVEDTATFESLEEPLVDPAAVVDELGGDDANRIAICDVVRGADAPELSWMTSASCPRCGAWLSARRRALRPKLPEYVNEETVRPPNLVAR